MLLVAGVYQRFVDADRRGQHVPFSRAVRAPSRRDRRHCDARDPTARGRRRHPGRESPLGDVQPVHRADPGRRAGRVADGAAGESRRSAVARSPVFWSWPSMAFTTVGRNVGSDSTVLLAVAGMAAASAMILPGVSGAYLFLVLGQYERILACRSTRSRVGRFAKRSRSLIPVAIGVLSSASLSISNLVRWTLRHHAQVDARCPNGPAPWIRFGASTPLRPTRSVSSAPRSRWGSPASDSCSRA